MPIFEYICKSCGWTGEVLLLGTDKEPTKCQKCGKGKLKKLLSVPQIRTKGRWSLRTLPDPEPPLQRLKRKGPRPGCVGGYEDLPEYERPERKGEDEFGNTIWGEKTKPMHFDMGK